MIKIKVFQFNPVQVNTYILSDKTRECIIIDAGCYAEHEEFELSNYIEENKLKPVRLINTHAHIDHILGVNYAIKKYGLTLEIHESSEYFLKDVKSWGVMLGIKSENIITPFKYLKEGEKIKFGESELEVMCTPGHADGSICLVNKAEKFVITGDVLFAGSIGRTDLPTGNYELLERSIREKLYILDDDYTIYPGHGPTSTIGFEKQNNSFIKAVS